MLHDSRQHAIEDSMREVATAQYCRLEGVVVAETTTTLWDWATCRYRPARCVVVSLGSRPPVSPWSQREAIVEAPRQQRMFRDDEAARTAHAYLQEFGVAPAPLIAEGTGLDKDKLKALMAKRKDLFAVAFKIAGQPYYKAVL